MDLCWRGVSVNGPVMTIDEGMEENWAAQEKESWKIEAMFHK